jgi:predicted dehydrogenase
MKIGIAGTGFMGETHAKCYMEVPGTEIYAVAEPNLHKRKLFSEHVPLVKAYNDVYDMIHDPAVDIIDICLPTPMHMPVAVAALNMNKHVLLEKPVALNLKDAEAIKEAAEKSSGKLMVAHVLRFWPEYITIRNILKKQMSGEKILSVYAARYNELPLWSENTWIMNEEKSGGLIIDLMIHDIDFFCWNFGKPKRVFSSAVYNDKNYAVQVMAALEMESGTMVYIDGGYLNPAGSGLSTQVRIYGSNSLLEMYPGRGITLSGKGCIPVEIKSPVYNGYTEEIKYFITCIKEGTEVETVPLDDAINSLKVCIALRESLKINNRVTIE